VAFVRTGFSEERIAYIIRVTGTGELGKTLAVTSNRSTIVFLGSVIRLLITANAVPNSTILFTPMMKAMRYSEKSDLTRATRHNIPKKTFFLRKQLRLPVPSMLNLCRKVLEKVKRSEKASRVGRC
jgi:hypothetical protein